MFSTLLRRLGSLPGLVLLLLVLGAAHPALAGHLLGGEMTYKYLNSAGPSTAPLRYEITVVIYNNCSHPAIRQTAPVAIYDQATGAKIQLTSTNYSGASGGNMVIPQTSISSCLSPPIPANCTITGVSQPYQLQYFTGIVNLPNTTQGFYAVWTDGTRNFDISNLVSPDSQNMTLYSTLSAPSLPNSSPIFSDIAVAVVCGSDTTYLLNNAVDPDGDRLTYSFGQPYGISTLPGSFTPPPTGVPYVSGYNSIAPFGNIPVTPGGNYAAINAATGIARYFATVVGRKYVVAVDVNEFRTINNRQVLIGTTRRDLQLVVANCPSTTPPSLPTTVATNPIPRNYTVEAGSTLTIPLSSTQTDGHPLTMTVTSVLLDGTGGYNATLGGNPGTLTQGNPAGTVKLTALANPTGPSTVTGSFVYTAGCNEARANPYDVSLTIKDDGCAGKLVADLLRITVTKPAGPNAVTGDLTICGLNTTHSYTATGGTAPLISWRAVGGTIVGSSTANPVQVTWPTAGTFTLVARGLTQYGCLTDSVTKTVTVAPASTLTVTGNQTICQGSSTTLTVNGGGTYTVTGGATPVTGTGPFVLSPTATTTYTITGVTTGTACGATTQVTITVNPLPTANAGAAVAICSGATGQLGTTAVAGNTYSWSPATGLSSTTIANPTVTLTNTTGAVTTQTYTLTTTTAAGCTGTATVVVTVSPQPTANAGAAVAICSGATGQLGTTAVAGNTYSWSPATGLSSPTAANPTVTLTNTTGAPITQTYTLTVTNAGGCTGTATVVVTVNPLPVALAGTAVAICSGATGQIGATAVTGLSYTWSPTTGLSSPTAANPTVTLTNTTGAPITQTYTLTTTSAAGCTNTATVVVTVNPLPTATAGTAVAICSGATGQLGTTAVAGISYNWSPATGLSSPTAANPTVTLTNTTGAPITQTYTLTVTNAGGCTGTATVVVTVNPLPTANAGTAVAICSGATGQLGTTAVAGISYTWSPAAGLSSPTAANPTVTLTNTTSAATTQTYTLTTTNASGCTATATVVVTVNPLPTANAGAAVAICSGATGQLGTTAVSGNTYSWSPATGLSSATVANPTVTLTNTTNAATSQTYTLTTTTAAGCTGTATVVVTVSPQPTANAGAAVAICSGATGQLGTTAVAGISYNWSPATGLSSPTAANPTVTLTNTTGAPITQTYTLTVTNAGGCTGTATVVVTVNPLPTANAGAAVAICSGATGQLGTTAVAGISYSWSPATGLSSPTAANPTVTLTNTTGAPITQTYTLTTTSATGCTNTATVVVTVNPLPVANAGAAVAICSGATGQLGTTAVAGLSYSWSPATGLSSPTTANPTVTLTNTTNAATTQTYTLTTTTAAGCTATATVVVTVNPLPVANAGAAVAICSGATGQLGTTAVSGLSYNWSPATGLSSPTAANPTVTLTNTTGAPIIQTYTLTTTNATGCTNTATVVVTVNPLPVANAGAAIAICSGATGQLGATAVTGNTYSWSPATGLSSPTAANPTVTLTNTTSAATTQTYSLTTTSAAGCTATATVVVTVNPLPVANAGAAVAICSGATGQLGATAVTGLSYNWSPATGLSSPTAANPTVTLTNTTNAATTQTYTLTTTTAAGCTATATVVVTVSPQPTANAGAAVAICSGATGQLGATAVAGLSYSWSPATGLSSPTVANPTVTLTNTTSAATTQTYTLTTTNATGCTNTATVVVTVNPLPVALAGTAVAICSGATGQLGDVAVTGNTYSWSPATGLSSPTAANPTVTLTNTTSAATTQTYTLTTTSAAGCTATATVVVTVNPLPVANAGAAVAICSGATGQLGTTAVAGLSYNWSPATGLSSPTAANPTVTLTNTTSAATTQTYTLTTTNASGCTGTATVVVTVNPLPTANAGAAVAICSGATGQLGATAVTGISYNWSPATGLSSSTAANPTVTLTNTTGAPITQTYTLTTTSIAGCTATATVVVTVNPLPTANAGAAVAICSGATGQLGATAATGLSYNWSPATGLSSPTAANPTVTLTNTTGAATTQTYTLTTTNATGCTATATVVVTVNPLPVALAGTAVAICSGATGQLGTTTVAGLSYNWSPATGLSSPTAANPTVTLTNTTGAATTQTYTLTTTNATGCTNTATVVVTVNPLPVALAGTAVAICSGATGQLGDVAVTGNTYSWSPATGLSSSTVANPTVTLTNTTGAPITQTYTLTTTSAAGCTATATVVVTVNPLPVANAGAAVAICSGATGQLGATAVTGLSYTWSPATGLSSPTAANPTVTLTNTGGAPITQTYTLTTASAAGCTATDTVVVTVNPAITAGTIGTDQTVCVGTTPAALTSTAEAGGGTGTYAYQWESSPDGITWTVITNATTATYAPGPATATVYYRRRVASGTCGNAVSNVVKVQTQASLATGVSLATPATQCAGSAITFTPVPTNAGPAPTYRWFVNGTLVATTATFTSSTLASGDQVQVELTPTVGFCATGLATATVPVTLTPVAFPRVAMSVKTKLPACLSAPITFSVDSVANAGTTPQYQWQVDGANVAGATARTFTSSTLSNGQSVTLTLRVPTSCGTLTVVSSAVAVAINPLVLVQAGPDKTITEGETVVLEGTANGTYPVTWTPSGTLTFLGGNLLRPVAAPLVTTTYTISGGIGDCASQSSVTVTVTPRVRIPNAISPNGDGRDDTWEIDNIGTYPENHVLVFNRWGNKIFETTNYNRSNEWNGNINGQPAPIGTYYYVITLGNGKSFSGPITVIY